MKNKIIYSLSAVILSFLLASCTGQTTGTEGSEEKAIKLPEASGTHNSHWSYQGETGPEHWGEIDPANSACVNGSEQSPINIEFSQVKVDEMLDDIQIQYQPSPFSLVNNGHTVQANALTDKNSIVLKGNEYKLAQFHFHTPSEHQFNGQHYAMELHLVHKDATGKLAVLGIMIQEGRENDMLAAIWDVLPKEETETEISIKEPIDIQALLPNNHTSFYYEGSLTTPPCTENVKWVIFEQPIEMSKEQIKAFQEIFPDSHRPVQPLNERQITKH